MPILGALIGAVFGTVFVMVNANEPLNPTFALIVRALAGLALASFLIMAVVALRRGLAAPPSPGDRGATWFGVKYWIVVVGELVLFAAGSAVLRLLDAPSQTGVAWVALVVGIHFIPFASIWRQRSILVPAWLLTAYGAIGLIMALTSAVAWIPIVSGVLSGLTLLTGSLYVASRLTRSNTANSPTAN
ncbi:hypothetical protein [Amycolatopsis albispora]|uniref:Uncharacterized protein n=1 Tax=Amycolatopsis albispora TaxID=1804986 RepID=A0A344LIW2_9PSEU|nr:hypothetical protein [Amycolatopsis albispora]AXB47986.1 hypothetical protein A4R43_40685 [Amycolatopsis albispora]